MLAAPREKVDRAGPTVRGGHAADTVAAATATFETAMDRIGRASRAIVERLRGGVDSGPTDIVVEFGLLARAAAGLVISMAGREANVSARVTWKRGD